MTGTHANHTAGYATRLAPLAALLACIGTALPPAVRAADTGPRESALHVGGRVDLTSDNRARGISTSASRPTAKLTAELLHNAGLFAELELFSELRAFQSEYIDGQPQVLVRLDAQLTSATDQRILASRRFEIRQPSASPQLESVVTAFGEASDELSRQLQRWTIEIAKSQSAQ